MPYFVSELWNLAFVSWVLLDFQFACFRLINFFAFLNVYLNDLQFLVNVCIPSISSMSYIRWDSALNGSISPDIVQLFFFRNGFLKPLYSLLDLAKRPSIYELLNEFALIALCNRLLATDPLIQDSVSVLKDAFRFKLWLFVCYLIILLYKCLFFAISTRLFLFKFMCFIYLVSILY